MTAADEFQELLKRESRWRIRRGVPIFRSHIRVVRRNGEPKTIRVSDDDLDAIANAMNAAEQESGTLAVITPGHLETAMPEDEQPRTYGYTRNARVGTFGPGAVKCILVDEWYHPQHYDAAKEYPYRSSVYYPHDKRIMSVALLKNRPALDLGTVTEVSYRYSMEAEVNPTAAPAPAAAAPQPLAPEEQALADKFMAYMLASPAFKSACSAAMAPATQPAPNAAEPSGSNTDPPKEEKEEDDVDDAKYSALESRMKAAEERAQKAEAKADRESVERIVDGLAVEYSLDRDFEVNTLVRYSAEDREKYVNNLKARYPKLPNGTSIPVDRTAPIPLADGKTLELTKEQMSECVAYAAEHFKGDHKGFDKARKLKLEGKF